MAFSQTTVRNACLYLASVPFKWVNHPDPQYPVPFVSSVTGSFETKWQLCALCPHYMLMSVRTQTLDHLGNSEQG